MPIGAFQPLSRAWRVPMGNPYGECPRPTQWPHALERMHRCRWGGKVCVSAQRTTEKYKHVGISRGARRQSGHSMCSSMHRHGRRVRSTSRRKGGGCAERVGSQNDPPPRTPHNPDEPDHQVFPRMHVYRRVALVMWWSLWSPQCTCAYGRRGRVSTSPSDDATPLRSLCSVVAPSRN